MPQIDIALDRNNSSGAFDFSFVNGDFKLVDSFDTNLKVSIFTDARANSSEVLESQRRRGWWGNQFDDGDQFDIGSKLWLAYQARRTQDTLNAVIDYFNQCLNWLVTGGYVQKLNTRAEFIPDGIRVTITFNRDPAIVETRQYDLWENTGEL